MTRNLIQDTSLMTTFFKSLILGLLVIVFTFPNLELTYSPGIDSPLAWVYNYLFDQGLDAGKHMIFPHGPLAFFLYPLSQNLVWYLAVESLLKLGLVFNLAYLLRKEDAFARWSFTFFIAVLLCLVGGFNHLILANLILLYLHAHTPGQERWRYAAYILTGFAFYVKAYVAILSGLLFVCFIGYRLMQDRRFKIFFRDAWLMAAILGGYWLLLFGSPTGFIGYVRGMVHLAQDNSSAAALYPENNWWMLGLFFTSLGVLVAINRSQTFLFYASLVGLSVFAAWKHGMARQDLPHVMGFQAYLLVCGLLYLVYDRKKSFAHLSVLLVAFAFFSVAITRTVQYSPLRTELFRVHNFQHLMTNYNGIRQYAQDQSREAITAHRLPQAVLDSIGQAPVDIYPWDYTYIPANDLRWQPRVVIQSYASYTSWLDRQNAVHFTSNKAPEYLIWQLDKTTTDGNGGAWSSIDNRYLLNDEPQTLIALLKHYASWYTDAKTLILRRREVPLNHTVTSVSQADVTWSKWCKVPQKPGGQLLRAKVVFSRSFVQRLKSFLYKDEQVWVYLRLSDQSIHKYRIVPKNSADGLWINPYVYRPDRTLTVEEIYFTASNEAILDKDIRVTWEVYDFDQPEVVQDFFGLTPGREDTTYLETVHDFETIKKEHWYDLTPEVLGREVRGGSQSYVLKPGAYSATFTYGLDSVPDGKMRVEAGVWWKSEGYRSMNDVQLVISIDRPDGNNVWKAMPLYGQLVDSGQWNHFWAAVDFDHYQGGCKVGVYLWNNSRDELVLDDFSVRLSSD